MDNDNFMKRITSFLVPSFVSNALTPRRGGNDTSGSFTNHHQASNAIFDQRQQPANPAASATANSDGTSQPLQAPVTSGATDAGFTIATERNLHQRPARSRGLGGTGGASLWTSFDHGGGGKRRFLDDDAGSSGSKRPRTLISSPSSSSSPTAATGLASTSLFYPGRTGYGGGFNAAASRSIRATPLHTSVSADAVDAAAALMQQPQLVTPTAKKILDALDRLSTPLVDARRMPSSSASASFVSAAPPFRVAYRRRMQAGQAPPTRGQQGVGSGVGVVHDTYRTRGLLEASLPQSQQRQQLQPSQTQQSEFQFSAPIFRGQRPSSRLLPPPPLPSAGTAGSWQCTTCMVTNAPGATACVCCSAAAKNRGATTASAPAAAASAMVAAPESQWRCDTCMCTSPASSQVCVVCQAKRPAAATSSAPAPAPSSATVSAVSQPSTAATAEWRCDTCMCTSPASSQVCIVCQAKRPSAVTSTPATAVSPPMVTAATAASEWRCDTCMCTSPASSQACSVCQAKRPGVAAASSAAATAPSPAVPSASSAFSLPKRPSFIDSGPATAPIFSMFSQQHQQPPPPPKWQCNTCLVENLASVSRCAACESPKPGSVPAAPATFTRQDGGANLAFGLPPPASSTGGETKISFGVPSTTSSGSFPKINFGAPSVAPSDSGPKINFGATSDTSSDSGPKINFGATSTASNDSVLKINFGATSTAPSDSGPKMNFGATSTASNDSVLNINFGATSTASSDSGPKMNFGATSTANDSVPKTIFGVIPAASTDSAFKTTFGVPPAASNNSGLKTNFGASVGLATSSNEPSGAKLSFGASVTSDSSVPKPAFGATSAPTSSAVIFTGAKLGASITDPPGPPKLSFGASQTAVPATFVFGAVSGVTTNPAADEGATGPKLSKPSFNFLGGNSNLGAAGINNGSSGSLFTGINGGAAAPVLFGGVKPNVDLDADLKPGGQVGFSNLLAAAPQASSGAFVFGSAHLQQQQQQQPQQQQQFLQQPQLLQGSQSQPMLPSNGSADQSNPFNLSQSANRSASAATSRNRITAKRRLMKN